MMDLPGKNREGLILFTRFPIPGKTKTRLIPSLGEWEAADLQRRMTKRTLGICQRYIAGVDVSFTVFFEGGNENLMSRVFGKEIHYQRQKQGDLGKRMDWAFRKAFKSGDQKVVLIGTDCPGIDEKILKEAFDALNHHDVVFGPAIDGGYYLIGMTGSPLGMFENIPWGTSQVLDQSIKAAQKIDLSIGFLEPLEDVDRPEDLPVWEQALKKDEAGRLEKSISVIIPALNEGTTISNTIRNIRDNGHVLEIIIVDGKSSDQTRLVAKTAGAKVMVSEPGRGGQMNAGANVAKGDILLFLHADTKLGPQFDEYIRKALKNREIIAGAFELRIDGHGKGLRRIERLANWRSKKRQMPYGDQGIFLRTKTFREIGGFKQMPIMEDFELMQRLNKLGLIKIIPIAAITSARRWQSKGILKTTIINQIIILAYLFGVSPIRLAPLYRKQNDFPCNKNPVASTKNKQEEGTDHASNRRAAI